MAFLWVLQSAFRYSWHWHRLSSQTKADAMIAAIMEMGMVALPHLVYVNAIIYTSDYEGKSQFRVLEQNNYII